MLLGSSSYLSAATFLAMPLDYDFSAYTTPQVQDILNRASGMADAFMRRSLLAQEKTIRYFGDNTNRLELRERPLLYVKQVQIIGPGTGSIALATNQLLIDYSAGSMMEYTPLVWSGSFTSTIFPKGIPVDVRLAWGYGTAVVTAPTFTSSDVTGSGLTPGSYNVAITAQTMYGETTANVSQVTTATGTIQFTVTPSLGTYQNRVYLSSAANNKTLSLSSIVGATTLTLSGGSGIAAGKYLMDSGANAEIVTVASVAGAVVTLSSATTLAHNSGVAFIPLPTLVATFPFTAYGTTPMQCQVNSLTPATGLYADTLPIVDTSFPAVPNAIIEAVRLLALSMVFEQNNLANRGLSQVRSNRKSASYRSTEGSSGKGKPLLQEQAEALLAPYSFQGIY